MLHSYLEGSKDRCYRFLPPRPHNLLLLLFVFIFCSHSASCWPCCTIEVNRKSRQCPARVMSQSACIWLIFIYSYSHILLRYHYIYLLDSSIRTFSFCTLEAPTPQIFTSQLTDGSLPRFLPRHSCCSSPLSAASHGIPGHRASRLLSWPPLTVKHGVSTG